MGKFSQAGSTGGGMSALERLASQAQADLPAGPAQEQVQEQRPRPNVQPQTAQDPGVNLQQAEELPSPFQQRLDPQQQLEADIAEQERHSVPDMRARWTKNVQPSPLATVQGAAKPDGGIFDRANRMAASVEAGGLVPPVSLRKTVGFPLAQEGASNVQIADALAAEKQATAQAAATRIGAVDQSDPRNPQIDPDFIKAGSLVTENIIMGFAGGADIEAETVADPIAEAFQEERTPESLKDKKIKRMAKQQGNAQIGKQIALEYQRLKGNPTPENNLTPQEAEVLGDTFKMMWAGQNHDLVKVTRDLKTDQKFLELKPDGEDALAKGAADRKRLFPTVQVRPAKNAPPRGDLRGDVGLNVTKKIQGGVDLKKKDIDPTITDAMRNLCLLYTSPSPRDS